MFYLLVQMALYMLITLALGIWLGWLLWRKGYIRDLRVAMGMELAEPDEIPGNETLAADYKKLREENSKLAGDLSRANSERNSLQNDLEACLAARKAQPAKTGTAAKSAAAPAAAVASTPQAKPAGLKGPRGGKADDLKEIKGIGPKLEKMLHGMGFYHFDQIAAWGKSELAWVDDNLEGFKGRASRDNWIPQAKKMR